MPSAPRLATLPKLSPTGTPASLRVILPPNLATAAARDAIAVRFEIAVQGRGQFPASMVPDDRALTLTPAHLSAVFLIESWNRGAAATMAQLSRAQLAALLAVLPNEPVFFFANRATAALPWIDNKLAGVSEHLGARSETITEADGGSALSPPPAQPRGGPPVSKKTPTADRASPVVDGSEHFLAIQLPSREHYAYGQLLERLKADGFRLEPSNRKWWLRDRHKTLNFLAENWSRLRDEWDAEFTPNFARHTAHLRFADVDAAVQPTTGGDFDVTLSVRAGNAREHDVHAALTTGRTYVEDAGQVFLFDHARLEKLHAAQRALAGTNAAPLLGRSAHRISPARLAEADAVIADISPNLQTPEEWRRRTEMFRNPAALSPAPAPAELDQLLRPYQRLGAAWLWHLRAAGLGGILADEMGLGKTLQALAVVSARRAKSASAAPSLVVCPASLLENWRREAARFAPRLRVRVHHGDARTDQAANLRDTELVVTSYGTLTRDQALFAGIEWDTLVADEAQHVKNRRTQNAQALQSLRAGGRILLTGTPVENSLGDLESLFALILPGYLKGIPPEARGDDRAWHEARVRRQAAPYILRRTKAEVTPELPEKIEQTIFVELTDPQRTLYESTRTRTEGELLELEMAGQSEGRIRMAMFTQLLRLRQICGDPRLLEPARDPAESAKLATLLELLDEAIDDGHRVLVFSQFTSLLTLVRAALDAQGTAYAYLDGAMPPRARQAEVDRFNAAGADVPVFFLSLKAGGTGLNLASADTVVHLDPWWNPAVEAQATDRAHRIGQTRVVTSYKLIAAGTVEERVLAMQHEKRSLLANVFEASDAANAALTLADLKALVSG